MGAKLFDWYQRLPENTSVTLSGQTRAKFDGVLFEIQNAGTGPAFMAGMNGGIYGVHMGPFVDAAYSKVRIILEKVGNRNNRTLWIKFDPPGGAVQEIPPPPGWSKGTSHGIVQPGHYVVIDDSRNVSVNGQLRRPQ
jgi:hypothetical protein